jgi:hypothetical protein
MTKAHQFYGLPGEPPRPSQRHTKPHRDPLAVTTFRAGDRITWNGRYSGKVVEILGDDALVVEENSLLGGSRTWQLELAALTRMPGR